MKKAMFLLLVAVFAFAGYGVQSTVAQEMQGKATAQKQGRWHGLIVSIDKENSVLVVRRENVTRKVLYDSSTKWTEGTKTIDMSEFKEGADVVCLGQYDDKVQLHATRIDLRKR